ncbi:MAG: hypothetical protein KDE51_23285 [Anaerolineales bacterium]|nr:hypothetical protein [Anaerolineales bacterium]
MEDNFAFIIHPINAKRDVSRKYPLLGKALPVWLIDFLSLFFPPVFISEINGIQSKATGNQIYGWFVACPLTPRRMISLPPKVVYRKIIQTGQLAEKLGANLLGLGAFTSVVGDGGITIAKHLNIPVTTGDSYTVAIAIQAIEEAANIMNKPIESSTVAIVGAAGAIGTVCAEMMAPKAKSLLLIGRDINSLDHVKQLTQNEGVKELKTSDNIQDLLNADLIITVTSAVDTLVEPEYLKPGAVICDVARPRDVSRRVVEERQDVLVIEGGMVEVPGNVDFGFDFGFPPQMAYACMAETMALALEKRYEHFTLGKNVQLSQVVTIDRIATKHGFQLGGFRSFEKAITSLEIAQIKSQLASNRLHKL